MTRSLVGPGKVRVCITVSPQVLVHLDAVARRRRRTRSRLADETLAEALKAVMLTYDELPPEQQREHDRIQALRQRLIRTILGGTVARPMTAWEAPHEVWEAGTPPRDGHGRYTRQTASNAHRSDSGGSPSVGGVHRTTPNERHHHTFLAARRAG